MSIVNRYQCILEVELFQQKYEAVVLICLNPEIQSWGEIRENKQTTMPKKTRDKEGTDHERVDRFNAQIKNFFQWYAVI